MSQAESQQSESCSYQSLDDTFTLAYDNNNIEDPLSPFSSARAPKHKKKPTYNWYQSHLNLVLVKWIAISFIAAFTGGMAGVMAYHFTKTWTNKALMKMNNELSSSLSGLVVAWRIN